MLNKIKLKETTANQQKYAGLIFIFAALILLVGSFMYSVGAYIALLIIGLVLILLALGFIVFFLTNVLELKPDASTPINIARFGFIFYLIILFVANIGSLFIPPGVFTIVIAVLLVVAQLVAFVALNVAFKRFSELLTPADKIDSPVFVIYGCFGLFEFIIALIIGFSGSFGLVAAFFWINIILSFILMLALGIVLILNSNKLLKYIEGATIAPTTVPSDTPSAKYYTGTEELKEEIFCPNCGSKLGEDSKFCPECGATSK